MDNTFRPKVHLTVRKQIKKGWTLVCIARQNLYRWPEPDWGDRVHFQEVFDWCYKTFPPGEWTAARAPVYRYGSYLGDTVQNRFVFKHSKQATMFRLRWSDVVR